VCRINDIIEGRNSAVLAGLWHSADAFIMGGFSIEEKKQMKA
jgi:hypothetical protein